jgi:LmbE family N-acetylglucosaminyl deacetylase
MIQKYLLELLSWIKVLLIVSVLVLTVFVTRAVYPKPSNLTLSDLTPFSMLGYQRLLILAPHCDDETLGSAGIIQAALRAGIQVRVVIATNGDGYLFATMQDFRTIYPNPQDFIRMGELRQKESLAALGILGVKPEQVFFLSYPDRGTPSLWDDNWLITTPYRSPYSENNKSPYPLTYNKQSVYAGEDYLADLTSILSDYHPDLIVFPHPDDVHPDHWGLNVFTRLAVTLLKHSEPTYLPTAITYLVHRPDFPVEKEFRPQDLLLPPPALYKVYTDWYYWDLLPLDVTTKNQAIQQYRSQLPLLRGLMESFVRANELFAPVKDAILPVLAQGDHFDPSTWLDINGHAIPQVQADPVSDFITRDAIPAADLVGFYAARDEKGNLLICSQTREEAIPELHYYIRLKSLTGAGIKTFTAGTKSTDLGGQVAKRSGVYVCVSIPLSDLGDPWAVYAGANVVGGGRVMDETAWQMIYINNP